MADRNSFKALSADIDAPLDVSKVARGWESLEEEREYWIPAADIEGTIPHDLFGTFFRNGPGINEVYGTPLKHRERLSDNLVVISSRLFSSKCRGT